MLGGRGSFALGRQGKALFEKMAFVPRTEEGEKVSWAAIWRRGTLDRRNRKCKGTLRNSRKTSQAGAEFVHESIEGVRSEMYRGPGCVGSCRH